jgi:hypothetical protein
MNCRSCAKLLSKTIIDLGFAPPSNAYLTSEQLFMPEKSYPLKVLLCESCWLVQTEDFLNRDDVFDSKYHYFSSTSTSWLEHSRQFTESIIDELHLNSDSFVLEVASNDGYLLQYFVSSGVPCLGIEPTLSTAKVSQERGIPTLIEFFGKIVAERIRKDYQPADLIIGNNVFAHVPDLHDFCDGIAALLSLEGVCTLEFPHLLSLLQFNQFDTIYHEHFSYLSLVAVQPLLLVHGLRIFKVAKLPTHGGSLRIYICRTNSENAEDVSVRNLLSEEAEYGLNSAIGFSKIWDSARKMKLDLLKFLIAEKDAGRKVVGYGAAAKGNTFLNYAGVDTDLIEFVVDAAVAKQSKYLPGSHIPIYSPQKLYEAKPDSILILPWNIADEVMEQFSDLQNTDTDFFVAVPTLRRLNKDSNH